MKFIVYDSEHFFTNQVIITLRSHNRPLSSWQVMVPYNYTDYIDALTSLVNMNVIPMTRIDDAVRRILRVKFTMGLFENPLADLSLVDQLGKKVIHV